jgi:hypothetical protein
VEPLYERVLAFIEDPAVDRFEDLALAIFAHQFARCAPYRDFATRRGATPDTVADWRDVPAVPIVAFKRADLTCGVPQRTFLSSGTTQVRRRGRGTCCPICASIAPRRWPDCTAFSFPTWLGCASFR